MDAKLTLAARNFDKLRNDPMQRADDEARERLARVTKSDFPLPVSCPSKGFRTRLLLGTTEARIGNDLESARILARDF